MKTMFLILLFAITFNQLSAQSNLPNHKRFGVKAGFNYSLMDFNKAFVTPDPSVKNIWKPGLYLGAILQLPLNRYFALQPEYAFTQMHGEDDRIKTTYKINYLTIPLLLKITVVEGFAIIAGPQVDLLISAKQKNNDAARSISQHLEERNLAGVLGVEVKLYRSMYADARYMKGFNHIDQRLSNTEFKWAAALVGLGVHF